MHDAHAQFGDGVTYLHIAHAQKESRGKYKKLEHSNEIYFPTLMFSTKSRTIERKRLEQIRTDLAVTPTHQLCAKHGDGLGTRLIMAWLPNIKFSGLIMAWLPNIKLSGLIAHVGSTEMILCIIIII